MRSGRNDLGGQQAEDLLATGIHLLLGGLAQR